MEVAGDLGKPVDDKIYFAGGEFTDGEDWVSVHTAAQSAKKAVDELNAWFSTDVLSNHLKPKILEPFYTYLGKKLYVWNQKHKTLG